MSEILAAGRFPGRRRRKGLPIPPAGESAGAIRILYSYLKPAHNVRLGGRCARCGLVLQLYIAYAGQKRRHGVSPFKQVLGTLIQKLSCALAALLAEKQAGHNKD